MSATGLSVDQLAQNVCVTGVPRGLLQEVRENPALVEIGFVVDTCADGVELGRCDDSVGAGPGRAIASDGGLERVFWTDVVLEELTLELLAGEAFEEPQRLGAGQMLEEPQQRRTCRDG